MYACVGGWFRGEFGVSEVRSASVKNDPCAHFHSLRRRSPVRSRWTAGVGVSAVTAHTCSGGDWGAAKRCWRLASVGGVVMRTFLLFKNNALVFLKWDFILNKRFN